MSDSESFISEADCKVLINDLEVDSKTSVSKTSSHKRKRSCPDPKKLDDIQQVINTKILTQKTLASVWIVLNKMLLAKGFQKSEEQMQSCLTRGQTAPQSPSTSNTRFEYFAQRFICAIAG